MTIYTYKIDTRDYSNPSNFVFKLNNQINKVSKFTLKNWSIPNSSYNVNNNNNSFTLHYNVTNYTINITKGNYNALSLATALTSLFNTAVGGAIFTITYDQATNKYTFVSSGSSFYFVVSYETGQLLGFVTGQTSTGTSLTSTNGINLVNTPYYYLAIQEISSNDYQNISRSSFLIDNNVPYLGISSNNVGIDYTININELNISQLTILLFDSNGHIVDLNGLSYLLMFEFFNNC